VEQTKAKRDSSGTAGLNGTLPSDTHGMGSAWSFAAEDSLYEKPARDETKFVLPTRLLVCTGRWIGSGTMMGRGTATARLESMGDQRALSIEQFCGVDSCQGLRVVTLGDENLCCDHFLSRCYDFLGRIDPQSGVNGAVTALSRQSRELVEWYSRRALEVSLGTSGLNNLQRARLLDILLWASDVCAGGDSRAGSPWGLSPVQQRTTSNAPPAEKERDKTSGEPGAAH